MSDQTHVQRFTESAGSTTLPLSPEIVSLAIANTAGAIDLRGADREDLRISWEKRGEPGTPAWDGLELEVEASPERISVRPRHPEDSGGPARIDRSGFAGSTGHGGAWLDLRIEAPQAMIALAVELANGSGATTAEGIACRALRIVAASGSSGVRDVAAETRIQSASGDVAASGVAADFHIRTASGDVSILARHPGHLTVETASGDVRLRATLPLDGFVRTVSGDVLAELAAQDGWRLDFRSVSGKASLPRRFAGAGRKAWSAPGTSGSEGSLRARTVSGELRVVDSVPARGGDQDTSGDPPARSRVDILQSVERGDLGVDDALRLLDDLADSAHPA